MKTILLVFQAILACSTFAIGDVPESLKHHLLVDMTFALGMNIPVSEDESNRREAAIKEALALLDLNPGAMAEFEALGQDKHQETSISAVFLQQVIRDYESQKIESPASPLISYYIARSKVQVLSPRDRVIAFVMIMSVIKQDKDKLKKAEQDAPSNR